MRLTTFLLGTAALAAPCSALAEPAPADAQSHAVAEIVVTAKRLDAARESIQPQTGASTYTMPQAAIEALPGGENVQLNQVVLQMPGVVQDSYGQLHVRGDHGDIQYRFNGVILPEGLSFFGQVISPRIANSIQLITGALPAEYGLRTAGILNIRTKSGIENGGDVGVYGGSHGEWEPSAEYGGTRGADTFFGSASYMQNQLGIESPNGSNTPRHDRTTQEQAFGFFDHIIDAQSRFSVFGGLSRQNFQIPVTPGLQPSSGYQFNNQTAFDSGNLNANQREENLFLAGSYLYTTDRFTGQAAVFARYSSLIYTPDALGELLYNGFQQSVRKEDIATGFQAEGAYRLGDRHTVRAGLIFENDRNNSAVTAQAFLADTDINSPTYGQAIYRDGAGNNIAQSITDDSSANAQTYSAYLQDEWKITEDFVLNYGLRFDQLVSFRRENQLSPRVNFVWSPLSGTTVHGGYARYFTPPPFELVANTALAKFSQTVNWPYALHQAYPGLPLDTTPFSERADYFDLGVQQKVGRSLTLGVDAYLRHSHHLIDEGQFGEAIILTPFNYQRGKISGGEVTMAYDRGPLNLYMNVSYTRAMGKSIESSQFNFSPIRYSYILNNYIFLDHNETWSSSFGAAYHWRDTKVSLDGIYGSGLRGSGANNIPNGVSLQTYTVFNVSLSQHVNLPWAGPLDARLDVVNLFDKHYQIRNGTGVGVGAPQWGAGRGVFVGLTRKF